MKAELRHTGQMAFVAKANSNHWVPVDAGPLSGGGNAATAPIELLAIAAGGCVSMDMIFIFGKSRKAFTRFEMEVEATRAETYPKRILSLHFHAQVEGEDMTPDTIEKAFTLSLTKYCAVSLSLDRSVKFFCSYTCNGQPGREWEIERLPEHYA
ncbi:MAG: OsmC family protein [Calditrichaeota bacterium]|nr:OsmC family protein [Calditrichota bacterium]MCB9391489.1 OsmC family protein [Calditrichota bacterium]